MLWGTPHEINALLGKPGGPPRPCVCERAAAPSRSLAKKKQKGCSLRASFFCMGWLSAKKPKRLPCVMTVCVCLHSTKMHDIQHYCHHFLLLRLPLERHLWCTLGSERKKKRKKNKKFLIFGNLVCVSIIFAKIEQIHTTVITFCTWGYPFSAARGVPWVLKKKKKKEEILDF